MSATDMDTLSAAEQKSASMNTDIDVEIRRIEILLVDD
jgi:hypothetical protein